MLNNKGFSSILLVSLFIVLIGLGGYLTYTYVIKKSNPISNQTSEDLFTVKQIIQETPVSFDIDATKFKKINKLTDGYLVEIVVEDLSKPSSTTSFLGIIPSISTKLNSEDISEITRIEFPLRVNEFILKDNDIIFTDSKGTKDGSVTEIDIYKLNLLNFDKKILFNLKLKDKLANMSPLYFYSDKIYYLFDSNLLEYDLKKNENKNLGKLPKGNSKPELNNYEYTLNEIYTIQKDIAYLNGSPCGGLKYYTDGQHGCGPGGFSIKFDLKKNAITNEGDFDYNQNIASTCSLIKVENESITTLTYDRESKECNDFYNIYKDYKNLKVKLIEIK